MKAFKLTMFIYAFIHVFIQKLIPYLYQYSSRSCLRRCSFKRSQGSLVSNWIGTDWPSQIFDETSYFQNRGHDVQPLFAAAYGAASTSCPLSCWAYVTSLARAVCAPWGHCSVGHGQGWGPRGLASTSRTARGQNFAALALASKAPGLGLGLDNARPRFWDLLVRVRHWIYEYG